jgi:hypothetical protein
MVLIASVAVSPTPRAIGSSLKLSMFCKVSSPAGMSAPDLLDDTVMIDQGFGYPAVQRWLRQIPQADFLRAHLRQRCYKVR